MPMRARASAYPRESGSLLGWADSGLRVSKDKKEERAVIMWIWISGDFSTLPRHRKGESSTQKEFQSVKWVQLEKKSQKSNWRLRGRERRRRVQAPAPGERKTPQLRSVAQCPSWKRLWGWIIDSECCAQLWQNKKTYSISYSNRSYTVVAVAYSLFSIFQMNWTRKSHNRYINDFPTILYFSIFH